MKPNGIRAVLLAAMLEIAYQRVIKDNPQVTRGSVLRQFAYWRLEEIMDKIEGELDVELHVFDFMMTSGRPIPEGARFH